MNKHALMYPKAVIAVIAISLILISNATLLYGAGPDKLIDIKTYYEKLSCKSSSEQVISLGNDTVWVELRQRDYYYWIYNYNPSSKFDVYAYSTVDLTAFSLGFAMNKRIVNIDTAYLSIDFSDFSNTAAVFANDAVFYADDTLSFVLFGAVDTLLNYIEARDTFYIGTCEFSIKEDLIYLIDDQFQFWFDSAFIPPAGDFIFGAMNGASLPPTIFENDTLFLRKNGEATDIRAGTIPDGYFLKQNYPNPFNPKTVIEFSVKSESFVQLDIYNLLGHKVKTLVNEYLEPGWKSIEWNSLNTDGRRVASGIYLYQLRIGDFVETKKMILLK